MTVLTGPVGSGKSHSVLAEVRRRLQERRDCFRLLVPTATMAEHVRNSLAREGFVFSPALVLTFSKFVEQQLAAPSRLPSGALELAVRQALRQLEPEPFRAVATLAGFERALVQLILDCSSAGCDSARLAEAGLDHPYVEAFTRVYAQVEEYLAGRGWKLRGAGLREAAERIAANGLGGVEAVYLDGFFQFTGPEIEVLVAIGRHAELTVTLPEWIGAGYARRALHQNGFEEVRLPETRRHPSAVVVEAATLAQETEEIARRILVLAAEGRAFRQIAIVVRGNNAYVPALRNALSRFGIPANFLFGTPLASHPAVRYLTAIVKALLNGWDLAETLTALRMSPSGMGATREGDRLDFHLRERLPGRGLDALRIDQPTGQFTAVLEALDRLDTWNRDPAQAQEWAARTENLTRFVVPPSSITAATHEEALLWRSLPAALEAFRQAARETALALGPELQLPFADFWREFQSILEEAALRVPDRRSEVVHVMDVYEARQWALPVVFVCGLLEKEFPRYHQQDSIFSDAIRLELQRRGVNLRTASDRQQEEGFLFELAASRATEQLVLSYPKFNPKGEENLRSFLLEEFLCRHAPAFETGLATRPRPSRKPEPPGIPEVREEYLRARLGAQHASLGPTSVEAYLQCPFRFFAGNTLRLTGVPALPQDRLDMPEQGSVVHRVLAAWVRDGGYWRDIFKREWESTCCRHRVPPGYRTESIRLELERNLAMLIANLETLPLEGGYVEQPFEVRLDEDFLITGKIDRLIRHGDSALVIDYKYTAPESIGRYVEAHEQGLRVQGGLYLIAAEEFFHLRPAGFLYCGTKKKITWGGWHTVGELDLCAPREAAEVRELMEQARAQTLRVRDGIRQGRIEPKPADPDQCAFCAYAEICRIETQPAVAVQGGGE